MKGGIGFTLYVSPFVMFLMVPETAPRSCEAIVSVRVWQAGEENADFRIDRAWSVGSTFELVTPYGRANTAVTAGAVHVEVYIDAVRAVTLDITIGPAPG